MYISIFSLFLLVVLIFYYYWQSKKSSENDLNIINAILAISYIEKSLIVDKDDEDHKLRFAFLLQYLHDMRNLKIKELNNKWIAIYDFFHTRTRNSGSGITIKFTEYGRIHPDVITYIADLYRHNSHNIGSGIWEDVADYFKEIQKENKTQKEIHLNNLEGILNTIKIYDQQYTGHIMMGKNF